MNKNEMTPLFHDPNDDKTKSLDIFHEAQQAMLDSDLATALDKLQQALIIAQKESDPEWLAYVEGTLAYLKGDLEGIKRQIEYAGANAKILSRLATGLEQRKTIDYKTDYGI